MAFNLRVDIAKCALKIIAHFVVVSDNPITEKRKIPIRFMSLSNTSPRKTELGAETVAHMSLAFEMRY